MLKQLGLTLSALLMALAGFALSALPASAAMYEVKMGSDTGQLKYVPETLTVEPGDTVSFVMNQIPPHNVVFDAGQIPGDNALASQLSEEQLLFSPGESYKVTFPEDAPAGEYNYYCQPHRGAGMSGKIVVE
ncbi:MAG: plastocyanin [Cyanobacteria bacterium QS_8_64_29]|nr:MAG: plastocyanin [Cyanobacteria bacterium QS_8_64_29]